MATVQEVQERLIELGMLKDKADGKLGKKTKDAIKAFQKLHGLEDDGDVGPKTEAELWPADISDRIDAVYDTEIDDVPVGSANGESHPFKVKPASKIWTPTQNGVRKFYGDVGTNQVSLVPPYKMQIAWDTKVTVKKFQIHEKCHDAVLKALTDIADAYDEDRRKELGFDMFGGSLNVRKMRGGNAWSMHSWGIAIDFDPERNQLKWGRDKARLAQKDCETFWKIWESVGGVSLGREKNYDWMHVQFARFD